MKNTSAIVFLCLLSSVCLGKIAPNELSTFVKNTCNQTTISWEGSFGKEYDLLAPRFAFSENWSVAVIDAPATNQIKMIIRSADGVLTTKFLSAFEYRRVLLVGDSVWFLQDQYLLEYDLNSDKIIGTYPTYPSAFTPQLTTRARGFVYDRGFIYVAHGELGVVIFDVANKKPVSVVGAGLLTASMAGAVVVHGDDLAILQGAYHSAGFNGVLILNLKNGTRRAVSYPPAMGVVDPYSSTMTSNEEFLFLNNSGWIHTYDWGSLMAASKPLAPNWLSAVETVSTDGGNFQTYLMVNGDLVVQDHTIVACSSVRYTPKGQRRPVIESRTIDKSY